MADRVFTALADLESFDLVQGQNDGMHCRNLLPIAANATQKLHRDCANALKPGGFILIQQAARQQQSHSLATNGRRKQSAGGGSPSRQWQRAGPTDPSLLVDVGTLISDFDGLVEVVDAREVEVTLQEGRFHRGPAVLTQLSAGGYHQ